MRATVVRFGVFEVDTRTREFRKRGLKLRVSDQSLRLLSILIDHAEQLVTREQLQQELWGNATFIDFDRAINKAISELRRGLGDSPSGSRFIETLPKRGYRFIASLQDASVEFSEALIGQPERGISPDSAARREDLLGRYRWNRRTAGNLLASIEHFTRAIEIDSRFARAHAGLADAHIMVGIWGLQPAAAAFSRVRDAAKRAVALDARLAEARTCMAEVLKDYMRDLADAEREFQRALALSPSYSTAHHWYAQLLVSLRRHQEAATHMELARSVDPASPAINAYLPYIYLAARDYPRAVQEAIVAVELERA